MDELQGPAGEGSSVDDVGEGNQSTDYLTSQYPDESKRQRVHEATKPQAAASGSVKCPNCGPPLLEFGEEVGPQYKPANSSLDETREAPPAQMQVSVDRENQQKILKDLQSVMSDLPKGPVDAELLKDCIHESSVDPDKLLHFFKIYSALHKKYGKGGNSSDRSEKSSHKAKSSSSSAYSWCTATVKVFSVVTGRTCGAHEAILEKVNKSAAVEITRAWQDCDIIMVFCPITSRVGSDVEAAMRDVPADKPAILVLMHHTRDVDYSTDLKKWTEDYRGLVLDVHVLFHETLQGLLKCPRNDQAAHQIEKVLKKHSKYNIRRWI